MSKHNYLASNSELIIGWAELDLFWSTSDVSKNSWNDILFSFRTYSNSFKPCWLWWKVVAMTTKSVSSIKEVFLVLLKGNMHKLWVLVARVLSFLLSINFPLFFESFFYHIRYLARSQDFQTRPSKVSQRGRKYERTVHYLKNHRVRKGNKRLLFRKLIIWGRDCTESFLVFFRNLPVVEEVEEGERESFKNFSVTRKS